MVQGDAKALIRLVVSGAVSGTKTRKNRKKMNVSSCSKKKKITKSKGFTNDFDGHQMGYLLWEQNLMCWKNRAAAEHQGTWTVQGTPERMPANKPRNTLSCSK